MGKLYVLSEATGAIPTAGRGLIHNVDDRGLHAWKRTDTGLDTIHKKLRKSLSCMQLTHTPGKLKKLTPPVVDTIA